MRATRYGIDGWPYHLGLTAAAVATGTAATVLRRRPRVAVPLAVACLGAAVPQALGSHYVVRGKFRLRDRLLDAVDWRGDEVVVDLGAGAGLLAVGAAHRTRATVHAVDLFVGKDLSGNSAARLRANAAAEGVADRVRVVEADVRATGLPDASADVVVSTLCLHNVPSAEGRRAALGEVVRVLRPGGTLALSDLAHVEDEYVPVLRDAGFTVVRTGPARGTFPPQRELVARAPGAVAVRG